MESTAITTPAVGLLAELPHPFVIEIAGNDACKVVNNLSTNNILKLASGGHCETFITDVRGWVVGHAIAIRRDPKLWLIGSHEASAKICNHLDRYIIREDARVTDHSADYQLLVFDSQMVSGDRLLEGLKQGLEQSECLDCQVPIISPTSRLIGGHRDQLPELHSWMASHDIALAHAEQFEWLRICNFWPLSPGDIGDKTIPQELDRDHQAISFTKGCYLGQETIARLDARGQLQKKLCLVEIVAESEEQQFRVGDKFMAGEKEVGSITSVARDPSSLRWRALALLRRGNFTEGTSLQCHTAPATVLEIPAALRS